MFLFIIINYQYYCSVDCPFSHHDLWWQWYFSAMKNDVTLSGVRTVPWLAFAPRLVFLPPKCCLLSDFVRKRSRSRHCACPLFRGVLEQGNVPLQLQGRWFQLTASSSTGNKTTSLWESIKLRHTIASTTFERMRAWGGSARRSGTRSQWERRRECSTAERRSAPAQTQHTFRWRWSNRGSRSTATSASEPRVRRFFLRADRWKTDTQPPRRPSVEITAASPPPRVTLPIATIDATQLHAFRSDHLSPVHHDGKCAH